jgi:putative DNA primase/helicase
VPIESEIARRGIKLRGRIERSGPCPICGGKDRFSINTKKGVWHCRSCDKGGDVIELVRHLDGVDFKTACTTLTQESPPQPNGRGNGRVSNRKHSAAAGKTAPVEETDAERETDERETAKKVVVAAYDYQDADGKLVFVVERIEYRNTDGGFVINKDGKREKTFRQKRPDPDKLGAWLFNVDGVLPIPYRLPALIKAVAVGCAILIVEGEAKVDLLLGWNVPATCCAGGAKKWKPEHAQYLKDADVVIAPDNDEAGRDHVNVVASLLQGIAKSIRVLVLPGLPLKGDIVDWAANGGTAEQLHDLIEGAPFWLPPASDAESAAGSDAGSDADVADDDDAKRVAKEKEDALLEALGKLAPGVEYARHRKRVAKELGVSGKAVDAELESRRDRALVPLYGHWIVDPWPEAADGDALLRDIIRRLQRHVVISFDGALATALWVKLAWVHDAVATHSPILNIHSAEPESGKSTTVGLLAFLLPRCIASVDISEAALYRSIQRWQPTFAIDEFDKALVSDDKVGLCAVVNSGHVRGQGVIRCMGDAKTPELFPTFCAKAIGMVGRRLPEATLSRCIMVELRRRKTGESIEPFTHKDDPGLADLRRRLARWATDNQDALRDAKPAMPPELQNRRADNWRLQLAIADLAGEDWGDKARVAAKEIEKTSDSKTNGVRALAAIKVIFDGKPATIAISSQDLVDELTADPAAEWAEWHRGEPITQRQLAILLKPFRIFPEQVWIEKRQVRGYKRSAFEDAWERYIGMSPPEKSVTTSQEQ